MKYVVIMFGTKKSRIVSPKETRKVLYRPEYMVYATYNPQTRRYGKRRLVRIKHNTLPDFIINQIMVNKHAVIVWSSDDVPIIKTLLQEAGVAHGTLKIMVIQNSLMTNRISYKTLSAAATDLGLKKCPRDGVISPRKLLCRFDVLKKLFTRIMMLAKCELFSEIVA